MTRRAGLTDADRAAWAAYASQVTPLPGRTLPALPEAAAGSAEPARPSARSRPGGARLRAVPPPGLSSGLSIGTHPPGVDGATWQRFRTGRLPAARRLDLHGHTAQRAFQSLSHFLRIAHADHVRCVEIITGRGSSEGGGVLRRELPLWLNLPELRPLVLAAAHPHPGNDGAVRVLLRRMRG